MSLNEDINRTSICKYTKHTNYIPRGLSELCFSENVSGTIYFQNKDPQLLWVTATAAAMYSSLGTRYLVLGTRYYVLCTRYYVLGTMY